MWPCVFSTASDPDKLPSHTAGPWPRAWAANSVQPGSSQLLLYAFLFSLYTWCREGNGTPLQYSWLEDPMDGHSQLSQHPWKILLAMTGSVSAFPKRKPDTESGPR